MEAASFLQRNATYELASVKKQIARNQQLQHVRVGLLMPNQQQLQL